MSAEALPPPTNSPDSLFYKLGNTPLRDLLRGRLTARLDLRRLVANSGLPRSLAQLVEETVRRTRLWRLEKLDVAAELISHFKDGLEAGDSHEQLANSFGDIALVAKLIRRARKRQRLLNRVVATSLRRGAQALTVVFTLLIVTYFVMAVRVFTGAPRVSRDYVQEFNAAARAIPPEHRAWPVYRQGFLALAPWPAPFIFKDIAPDRPGWDEYVQFAKKNSLAIDLFHSAARMPQLGTVLFDPDDAELLKRAGVSNSIVIPSGLTDRIAPTIISAVFPEYSVLRTASQLLTIDAYLAVKNGNSKRTVEDLDSLLQIAEQLSHCHYVIAGLVAATVCSHACRPVAFLLEKNPKLLDENQLLELSRRFYGIANNDRLKVDRTGVRAFFDDFVQRTFTDNGEGDGILAPTYLSFMNAIEYVGQSPADTRLQSVMHRLVLPTYSFMHAGKRVTLAKFDDLMRRMAAEQERPLWQQTDTDAEDELERLHGNPIAQWRYTVLLRLTPTLSRASFLFNVAAQEADACAVALALEAWFRRHGAYPSSLDGLVPEFIPTIPPDRYDGKPIKYKLVDGKPLLYSVGANRQDDGGTLINGMPPDKANQRAREWIAPKWLPTSTSEQTKLRGDWILWPPIESGIK